MIRLKRKTRLDRSAEITPLIDVVFILLIFFLLTAVYAPHGLKLKLPSSQTASALGEDKIVLSVTKDEGLFFNGLPTTLIELKETLKEVPPQRSITIEADQDVRYGLFIQVVDLVRQNGAHPLVLAAELSKTGVKP